MQQIIIIIIHKVRSTMCGACVRMCVLPVLCETNYRMAFNLTPCSYVA